MYFIDCYSTYYTETREIVIMNLEDEVQAVYDAEKVKSIYFE